MGQFIYNVQTRLKTSSTSLLLYSFKVVTGVLLGLVSTIIGQTIIGYGDFAFWFVIVLVAAVFLRLSRDWGGWGVMIFILVTFLTGLLLNLYIQMAPGA